MTYISSKQKLKKIILEKFNKLSEEEYNLFCETFNEKYDYSQVSGMSKLFTSCENLTKIPPLKTSHIKSMSHMFYNCKKLKEIPYMDTFNVENMNAMFYGCENLEEIPLLDTSNVTTMSHMFFHCKKLKKIPNLDVKKVIYITKMFYGCYELRSKFNNLNKNEITRKILLKNKNIYGKCKYLTYIDNIIERLKINKVKNESKKKMFNLLKDKGFDNVLSF